MSLASLLFITGLLILVIVFVTRPLVLRESAETNTTDQKQSALLAERERILTALLELDFDNEMEKVPQEIYGPQRNVLAQRGAEILRQLDEMGGDSGPMPEEIDSDIDRQIEALIAARRKKRRAQSGRFCHNCGEPVKKTDQFCSNCGAAVNEGR
jgi:hypothetical protein